MKKIMNFVKIITLILVAFALSLLLKEMTIDYRYVILGITCIILLVLIILNVIWYIHVKKKFNKSAFKTTLENIKEHVDQGIYTYESSSKKLSRMYFFSKTYIAFILILNICLIGVTISIMYDQGSSGIMGLALWGIYTMIGVVYGLSKEKEARFGYYINPEEYPKLYEFVESVKEVLDYEAFIPIYVMDDNNFMMSYHQGKHHLSIGILPLMMLSKEELRSVLFHEMGHVLHKDSMQLGKRFSLMESLEEVAHMDGVFALSNLYFFALGMYLTFEFKFHEAIISKTIEQRSDQVVLNKDLNEAYISAGIKMFYLNRFLNQLYIQARTFEREMPNQAFYETLYGEFVAQLPSKLERYQSYIEKEIEPKNASHPNLRNRMNTFGIKTFNILPFSSYHDHELEKLLVDIQKNTEEDIKTYQENRKELYLKFLEDIKRVEIDGAQDELSKLDYAYALIQVGAIDKAYQQYEAIIKENSTCAQAIFFKGLIELREYDDENGVEQLYLAASLNRNYVESLEEIGDFALRMGNQKILDEFKVRYLDMVQKHIDTGYDQLTVIHHKTTLSKASLKEEIKNQIIGISKESNFKQVFVVEKELGQEEKATLILVLPDQESKHIEEAMHQIFKRLDAEQEQYGLDYIRSIKILKKVRKITEPIYERSLKE